MDPSDCLVDSSVFVALYRDTDSQHAEALRVMTEHWGRTLIIHPYVIQETVSVLTRKGGFDIAKAFLLDIVSSANIIIPAVDVHNDIGTFLKAGLRISFTDMALISLAKRSGAQLITFDQQMLGLLK